MRIFGLNISRAAPEEKAMQTVSSRGGWFGVVLESFAGAWQRNVEVRLDDVLRHPTVYACITTIANDIAKMRLRLVEFTSDGIWTEVTSPAFSPVLRKPNNYQTRIEFVRCWVQSLMIHGNTYVLKERDNRDVVTGMYILDPRRVSVLVSDDGEVFYELHQDNLAGIREQMVVPAREIIHDRINALYHPLVGVPPLQASGMAAMQGNSMQKASAAFFRNGARPAGYLQANGVVPITPDQARDAVDKWQSQYSGEGIGRTAILPNGLEYKPLTMTAVDSQLVEQLKWSDEKICSTFRVPAYMVGVGPEPTHNNVEARNQLYYSQCLQVIIEGIELCLDEGLGLDKNKEGRTLGTEFDLDDLLRMDQATLANTVATLGNAAVMSPNEARKKFSLPPVPGGDTPYKQHQDYSLAALAERDADKPFSKPEPSEPAPQAEPEEDDTERAVAALRLKFAEALYAA